MVQDRSRHWIKKVLPAAGALVTLILMIAALMYENPTVSEAQHAGINSDRRERADSAGLAGLTEHQLKRDLGDCGVAFDARLAVDGGITPRSFEWEGTHLTVEGVGRRWAEDGGLFFSVMAMGGRLFELRLDEETLCWSIEGGPLPRIVV